MKKIIVLFFLMILIVGNEGITFASYKDTDALQMELTQQLQQIFEKRVKVWNGFLTGGQYLLEDVKEELSEFIGDPLLTTDIEIFTEMLDNPTSYEVIEKVDINDCKIISVNNQNAKLEVKIFWVITDYKATYTEEIKYNITMERASNRWLLTNYEISR